MRLKIEIERAELRLIELRLVQPFETSFGREEERPALIVALYSDGAVGWGECVASSGPWYSYETATTAWHVLEEFLLPRVLHQELDGPQALWAQLAPVRGHNMAKAALEMAFWDLWAKLKGVSLAHLLGGTKERVESGVSLGIKRTIPELLEEIARRLEEGYPRIKLKIKPGWDLKVLEQVRAHFPDIKLQVDANAAYTLADLPLLKGLDRFGLLMVEQPFAYDDLVDHAALQRELETPICLDESIPSLNAAKAALALGSCRIINIKPGRVGGLTQAIAIHDYCRERGLPVWCGGMLETGIGRAHNVALASLPGFSLPNDLSASRRYWEHDIIEPEFELNEDGTISVPKRPGIGVEVLKERLEAATLRVRSYK
ncbi:MAG: o-succinylbenzoate synthase [Candidatus Acetothermia bacterium]|jgi:O-succinylbenzoate synthase|nr:o-succinylbenzoate synthase [Candidatus Acetothermia bacterium]MDH7505041.1 o-succinylbenzoate synthase [Candidatus Acetothermia bacterium]